jgi:hypothetical protein
LYAKLVRLTTLGAVKNGLRELVKVGLNWIIGFMILRAEVLQRCKNAFVLRVTFC